MGAASKNRWDPQRKNFHHGVRMNVSNGPDNRKQFEINNNKKKTGKRDLFETFDIYANTFSSSYKSGSTITID